MVMWLPLLAARLASMAAGLGAEGG